jgi:long-chain-fatty-acid--CoA ligase ACSBG
MQAIGKQTTGIKKTIATWLVFFKIFFFERHNKNESFSRSKSVGLSYNRRRMEG